MTSTYFFSSSKNVFGFVWIASKETTNTKQSIGKNQQHLSAGKKISFDDNKKFLRAKSCVDRTKVNPLSPVRRTNSIALVPTDDQKVSSVVSTRKKLSAFRSFSHKFSSVISR